MFEIMPQSDGGEPPTSPARHVFVYGTLRRGEQRDINQLRPTPKLLGAGYVAGMLYDLGSYPGVVLGGAHRVEGELYEILPALERQLDEIEAVWPAPDAQYRRRGVLAHLSSGGDVHCLVYEVTHAARTGKPCIASGDWLVHRRA